MPIGLIRPSEASRIREDNGRHAGGTQPGRAGFSALDFSSQRRVRDPCPPDQAHAAGERGQILVGSAGMIQGRLRFVQTVLPCGQLAYRGPRENAR
jgi:hypothetical protein